jgi:hypothetical protein
MGMLMANVRIVSIIPIAKMLSAVASNIFDV